MSQRHFKYLSCSDDDSSTTTLADIRKNVNQDTKQSVHFSSPSTSNAYPSTISTSKKTISATTIAAVGGASSYHDHDHSPYRQQKATNNKELISNTNNKKYSNFSPISPATKTLNDLSQIDALGGGDLIYDHSQHTSTSTTSNKQQEEIIANELLNLKKNLYHEKNYQQKQDPNMYNDCSTTPQGYKKNDTSEKTKRKEQDSVPVTSQSGGKKLCLSTATTEINSSKVKHQQSMSNKTVSKTADSISPENISYFGKVLSKKINLFGCNDAANNENDLATYSLHLISLPEQGPLGIKVHEHASSSSCIVSEVRQGFQGERFGVEVNDIICLPPTAANNNTYINPNTVIEAKFDDVLQWSASSERPIRFLIKRMVSDDTNILQVKVTNAQIKQAVEQDIYPTILFCSKCNNPSKNIPYHHTFCPKHQDFHDSGAKEKMIVLMAGVRDNCKACSYEFTNGKKSKNLLHNQQCGRSNRSSVVAANRQNQKQKGPIQVNTSGFRSTAEQNKTTTINKTSVKILPGRGVSCGISEKTSRPYHKNESNKVSTILESDKGSHNYSDNNIMQPNNNISPVDKEIVDRSSPTNNDYKRLPNDQSKHNKDGTIHVIKTPDQKLSKPTNHSNQRVVKILKSNSKSSNHAAIISNSSSKEIRNATMPKRNTQTETTKDLYEHKKKQVKKSDPRPVTDTALVNDLGSGQCLTGRSPKNASTLKNSSYNRIDALANKYEDSLVLIMSDKKETPTWVPCPNPWGPMSHMECDFVLVSPADYNVAFELQKQNHQRFVLDPFDDIESPYMKTHTPPEVGYRVLQLTRDRLALRSWGFSFCFHDFGGACIVTGIEPMSPAFAARDVGCGSNYRNYTDRPVFEANDMVICVNGKKVGGMTEIELAVELDVSGSEIIIVVSKYKKEHNSRYVTPNEKSSWSYFESEQTLHWNEIGIECTASNTHDNFDENGMKYDKNNDLLHKFGSGVQAINKSTVPNDECLAEPVEEGNGIDRVPTNRYQSGEGDSCAHGFEKFDKCTNDFDLRTERNDASFFNESVKDVYQKINMRNEEGLNQSDQSTNVMKKTEMNIQSVEEDEVTSENAGYDNNNIIFEDYPLANILEHSDDDNDSIDSIESNQDLKTNKRNDDYNSRDEHNLGCDDVNDVDADYSNDDDEDPWLGCVCGITHEKPIPVFWIQCDSCDAWYNVNSKCVGFDEKEAARKTRWECISCDPSSFTITSTLADVIVPSTQESNSTTLDIACSKANLSSPSGNDHDHVPSKPFSVGIVTNVKSQPRAIENKPDSAAEGDTPEKSSHSKTLNTPPKIDDKNAPSRPYPVGTVVNVKSRLGPGENKPGGVAKIVNYRYTPEENDLVYDVRYVLGGRESNVDKEYVSFNEYCNGHVDVSSPVGTRGVTKRLKQSQDD